MVLRSVLFSLLLLAPAAVTAGPILSVDSQTPCCVSLGLAGVHLETDIFSGLFPFPDGGLDVTGSITFTSGALLDLTSTTAEDGRPITRYSFEPGTLTLHLSMPSPDGVVVTGELVAPVPDVIFDVFEIPGESAFTSFLLLDPGVFDASLAAVLGESLRTTGGSLFLIIDTLSGDATDPIRVGEVDFAQANVVIPEPSAMLLVLGGLASVMLRLRRPALEPMAAPVQGDSASAVVR